MGSSEPALSNRGVRIDGALEHDLFQIARNHPEDNKQIGIDGG